MALGNIAENDFLSRGVGNRPGYHQSLTHAYSPVNFVGSRSDPNLSDPLAQPTKQPTAGAATISPLAMQIESARSPGERFQILADAVKKNPASAAKQLEGTKIDLANLDLKGIPNADLRAIFQVIPAEKISLNGANLANQDLSGLSLQGGNFAGAVVAGANFAGATLTEANFEGAMMRNTNFEGAKMGGANLSNVADMRGANFSNVVAPGINVSQSVTAGAKFLNTDFNHALTNETRFDYTEMGGLNLDGVANGTISTRNATLSSGLMTMQKAAWVMDGASFTTNVSAASHGAVANAAKGPAGDKLWAGMAEAPSPFGHG